MKTIRTRAIVTFLSLIIPACMVSLSAQTDEQIERFKRDMEVYYNEQLQLTPAEQEKFWPLYNDFYNRKLRHDEEERNMYRYCHSNVENMSDEEITQSLEKIMRVKDEKHKLHRDYHEKFLKILPPKKVLLLYKVERDFRMHLIRQLRKRGSGNESRGGRGSDMGPGPGMGQGAGQVPGADIDQGPGMGLSPALGF